MITPSREQIEAQVRGVLRKLPQARRIGLRAGRFGGDTELEIETDAGPRRLRILSCRSQLELRQRLAESEVASPSEEEPPSGPCVWVFLADLAANELGADVVARLAKGQLIELDRWVAARDLFKARRLDPRVVRMPWLADVLLQWAPSGGYSPVPGGVLDEGTARRAVLDQVLGLGPSPTRAELWRWLAEPETAERWERAPEPLKAEIVTWWQPSTGDSATAALALLTAGTSEHASALGLLLKHLGERAQWRLSERYLAGVSLPASSIEEWAEAARETVEELDRAGEEERLRELTARAETLWTELEDPASSEEAESRALDNDWLPSAFDLRLKRVQSALGAWLEDGSAASLRAGEAAFVRLREHRAGAGSRSARCDRLGRALALMRRLRADPDPGPNLASSITHYADDGVWADLARRDLDAGDADPELSELYRRILERATEQREAENRRFAERIRDAGATVPEDPRIAGLEEVVERWLAPWVDQGKVLFLVLDGLGQVVLRDLLPGLRKGGWREWTPDVHGRRQALGLLPTETKTCRTSLLCGRLQEGSSRDEQKGFEGHEAWRTRSVSAAYVPPGGKTSQALPSNVVDLLHGSTRVVAVVLGEIDAHFESSSDLRRPFSVDSVGLLPRLLEEAAASDRRVMITGDHGQVQGFGLERLPVDGERSGRSRSAEGASAALEGEVRIRGRRVIDSTGSGGEVLVPWSERLRYRRAGKTGYHGGATPQEMVVPVVALSRANQEVKDWFPFEETPPEWWSPSKPPDPEAPTVAKPPPRRPIRRPEPKDERQMVLLEEAVKPVFEQPAGDGGRPRFEALFRSPVYVQQLTLAGRRPPSEDQVRSLLEALSAEGGQATRAALARRLPGHRLRGLLSQVGRVLNVDGYPVITVDETSETVTFDRNLLERQFELEGRDRS